MAIVTDEAILRQKSTPVKNAAEGFDIAKKLQWALEATNKRNLKKFRKSFEKGELIQGLGLSAPQIGILKQVCLVVVGGVTVVLINPKIVDCSPSIFAFEEGCLSMPEVKVETQRHDWIKVQALNHTTVQTYGNVTDDWSKHNMLQSVVFQHEIAHLYGLLITDFVGGGPDAKTWGVE